MPPDQSDPDGLRSPYQTNTNEKKKSWAEIVHDDIKKVTQEEVDRMEEAFETERKKWNGGQNVVKNDYGIRRKYIEQLREMQSKKEREEIKYDIMKIKIVLEEETAMETENHEAKKVNEKHKPIQEMDLTRKHWKIKKIAKLIFIEMLGQHNKKMILEAKEKHPTETSAKDFKFITPVGEFALGDNVYVKFNKKFNPGTNMKTLENNTYELYGKKWSYEIQDKNEIMRASGGKKTTVLLKDAARRFSEDEIQEWLSKFGQIHSIRRVDPRSKEAKEFIEEEIKKDKSNVKEINELLLLIDERFDEIEITASDYEVSMTIMENIPNLLPICDIRIVASYQNQPPQCYNCYRMGHYSSFCVEKRVDYGIYSLFANTKWGSKDHANSVEHLRLREAVSHKKNIITEVKKGREIENVKPRLRSMGTVMQNKIGEVMKKNMTKRFNRPAQGKEVNDKCWNLHRKITRLNDTQETMLTPKGKELLAIAKNGFKDMEGLTALNLPLKMCELSFSHVESEEEITKSEIILTLNTWKGFQIEPDRRTNNDLNFPLLK